MPPLTFSPLTALMFGRVNLLDGYQKTPASSKIIKFEPSKHLPQSKYFQRRAFCELVFSGTNYPFGFSTNPAPIVGLSIVKIPMKP
jgi:hypothetical protein